MTTVEEGESTSTEEVPPGNPDELTKNPTALKEAHEQMATLDVHVCGQCHSAFHFVEEFKEHKDSSSCTGKSPVRDSNEGKAQVWAFLLWKCSSVRDGSTSNADNSWKLYQQWCRMPEAQRTAWITAGSNVQALSKFAHAKVRHVQDETLTAQEEKRAVNMNNGEYILEGADEGDSLVNEIFFKEGSDGNSSSQEQPIITSTTQCECDGYRDPKSSFRWTTESTTSFEVPAFDNSQSGFNLELSADVTEIDVFQHFVDIAFISKIAETTNIFHKNCKLNVDARTYSRLKKWHDVTYSEMYIFLAVLMLMTRYRHLTLDQHWSTDILLQAPIFTTLMSRNRFCSILGMLHFSMRSKEKNLQSKVAQCVNHAREKFKSCIKPARDLFIDESIVPFKGILSRKHYPLEKRDGFGIKIYVLCDVLSGAIVDFVVDCGGAKDIIDPCCLGAGGAIVVSLLNHFFGSNRHVYLDERYTSPALCKYLFDHGVFACGTVKRYRKGMPIFSDRHQRHAIEVQYCGPLMALKWNDNKDLYLLSTIHDSSTTPSIQELNDTRLPIMNPKALLDYSKNMGRVDTADMQLSSLQCISTSVKWHKRIFCHIIDMHLLNSFYCYREASGRENLKFAEFQLSLVRQLIARYHSPAVMESLIPFTRSSSDNPSRILPRDAVKHMPTRMDKYQRCKQCANNRERRHTRFTCKICNVYLCVAPCFQQYHSSS